MATTIISSISVNPRCIVLNVASVSPGIPDLPKTEAIVVPKPQLFLQGIDLWR
jgi:hypothetical protein